MSRKPSQLFQQTQVYRLGCLYKELGEMLMDERTDLRDLAIVADKLGLNISVSFGEPDDDKSQSAE